MMQTPFATFTKFFFAWSFLSCIGLFQGRCACQRPLLARVEFCCPLVMNPFHTLLMGGLAPESLVAEFLCSSLDTSV